MSFCCFYHACPFPYPKCSWLTGSLQHLLLNKKTVIWFEDLGLSWNSFFAQGEHLQQVWRLKNVQNLNIRFVSLHTGAQTDPGAQRKCTDTWRCLLMSMGPLWKSVEKKQSVSMALFPVLLLSGALTLHEHKQTFSYEDSGLTLPIHLMTPWRIISGQMHKINTGHWGLFTKNYTIKMTDCQKNYLTHPCPQGPNLWPAG